MKQEDVRSRPVIERPLPTLTIVLTESDEPMNPLFTTDILDPARAKDLKLADEPSSKESRTLTLPEPNSLPNSESPLPSLEQARTLRDEPKLPKPRALIEPPARTVDLTLRLDPSEAKPNVDVAEPHLTKDLMLTAEPQET